MIELLLLVVVYPIAQRIGERWLDRVAEGIDEKLAHLMKKAVRDKRERPKVTEYLRKDKVSEEKLKENIQNLMEQDVTNALAATLPPIPGARLSYYKTLIEWIANTCVRFKRQVVLKGFLNGEEFLSYFVIKEFGNKLSMNRITDSFIYPAYGFDIYLEKISVRKERDEKFNKINRKIRMSTFKRLEYDDYRELKKVKAIHEHWVHYDDWSPGNDFLKLSEELQDECEIESYSTITNMITSLEELISIEHKDIENLRQSFNRSGK